MSATPWILISVAILLILGVLAVFYFRRKKKTAPDYYAFFVMGIIWLIAGAISMIFYEESFNAFFAMGVIFTILGLAHRKDWKKNRRSWNKMDKDERRMMMLAMIALGILVLLLGVFLYLG